MRDQTECFFFFSKLSDNLGEPLGQRFVTGRVDGHYVEVRVDEEVEETEHYETEEEQHLEGVL